MEGKREKKDVVGYIVMWSCAFGERKIRLRRCRRESAADELRGKEDQVLWKEIRLSSGLMRAKFALVC